MKVINCLFFSNIKQSKERRYFGRRSLCAVGVVALAIVMGSLSPAFGAEAKGCVNDNSKNIDAYIKLDSEKKYDDPSFKKVSSGISIIVEKVGYEDEFPVRGRSLPLDDPRTDLYGLVPPYRFVSPCRVENPSGYWWAVEVGKMDGSLTYVPIDKLVVVRKYK